MRQRIRHALNRRPFGGLARQMKYSRDSAHESNALKPLQAIRDVSDLLFFHAAKERQRQA